MWCHLLLGVPLLGIALFFFLPLPVALPLYFAASAFVWVKVYRAMRIPVAVGQEAMVGRLAPVESCNGPRSCRRGMMKRAADRNQCRP